MASGNFATMNPLHRTSNSVVYSNGNLTTSPGSNWSTTTYCRSTMVIPKDKKIYVEMKITSNHDGQYMMLGCATNLSVPSSTNVGGDGSVTLYFQSKYVNGTETGSWITGASAGDILQLAVDGSNNKVWLGYNNTWGGSGNPSAGSNEAGTINTSTALGYDIFIACTQNSVSTMTFNFGQDSTFGGEVSAGGNADANGFGDFFYSVPSGYLALCSGNLGMSADIDPAEGVNPTQFHDTIIYTGDGGTATSITGLNFQPDWVLIKNRDQADGWLNQNSVSGVGVTHEWNDDGPYESETDCITAFNSDGFTLSNDHKVNANTEKYVAYCWKKSADAGFDIVEYSGNGSTNNVSHSLGATPDCIMMHLKSGSDWDSTMYFNSPSMGTGEGVFMTLANAGQTSTYVSAVSSSTFTPTTSANTSTRTYVAYLFRSIPGFSHFGEFEGNGNADGPFIYTGFRPKFIFFKAIDASENWQIRDTARQTYNDGTANRIYWNTNAAEGTASTASPIDFLTNGFKIRGSNTEINSNTIIYGAWGDVPFKYNNTF